jgi:hypothetical protein
MVNARTVVQLSSHVQQFFRMISVILFVGMMQSGCAIVPGRLMLEDVYRPDPRDPRATVTARLDEVRASLTVVRRGQSIPVTVPMDLEFGDEVSVRPPSFVTIVFPEGHEVTLTPNSRVRLGSLWVFIGEMFVRARGAFKTETEYWTAGVKGTEFYVRIAGNQPATLGVLEGSVGLESKTGGWKPIDVNENEVATLDRDRAPSKQLKQRAELDAILQLMRVRPPKISHSPMR